MCMYDDVIAVTNRHLCRRPFLEQIERICRLHPKAVLLREKDLPQAQYLHLAEQVLKICRAYHVPCILHTYPDAAVRLSCTCVHLPLHDFQKYQNKSHLQIGTSVHSVEEAKEAELLGASWLIAGHIFATDCKKGLPPRGTAFLSEVCRAVSIPVYAIGGIKTKGQKLEEIRACAAAGGCIMSEMMEL